MYGANTFFIKKPNRKWTWRSPDGRTKNEIDHILTDNLHMVKDIGVLSTFLFSSDHLPIRCKIRKEKPNFPNRKRKDNIENNIPSSLWIPVHRRLEAEQKLGEELNLVDWENTDSANFQENYD